MRLDGLTAGSLTKAAIAALAVLFLAVKPSSGQAQQSQDSTHTAPQGPELIDRVVAVVGSQPILLSDVNERIQQARGQGMQVPEDSAGILALQRKFLQSIIDEEVVYQQARRDTTLQVTDAEVQNAVDGLKGLNLVFEGSSSRVVKFEHNIARGLGVPGQSAALMAVLMLRGPQTVSELRANSERLHRFADLSAVEGFLDELAARPDDKGGPLAARLARAPGSREARWAQLLTGPVSAASLATAADREDFVAVSELAALKARLAMAEAEIVALRSLLDRVCTELDISRP
jgi:hypothetical protein